MAFVCSATWVAKSGMEEVVEEALKQLSPVSRTEPGNIYYQAYRDPNVPGTFKIFEVYKDEESFKAHGEYDHFRSLVLERAVPALEERRREFFQTLDF